MNDKQNLKDAINALYQGAGISAIFDGQVNENVARVFGQLLESIHDCSIAFKWMPKPTGGVATIGWIAINITRSIIEKFRDRRSFSCARVKILQYKTPLHLASIGL